jgi:hypothetical protein
MLTPWSMYLFDKLNSQTSKETSHKLRNMKIHYCVHKNPLLVYVLNYINSYTPYHMSWKSILMLSSHLHLCLTCGFFPLRFSTKIPVFLNVNLSLYNKYRFHYMTDFPDYSSERITNDFRW